jgi:hypothetical protein
MVRIIRKDRKSNHLRRNIHPILRGSQGPYGPSSDHREYDRGANIGLSKESKEVFVVEKGRDGSGFAANGNDRSGSPSAGRYQDTR